MLILLTFLLVTSIGITSGKTHIKENNTLMEEQLIIAELYHIENTGGDTFQSLVNGEYLFVIDMQAGLKVYSIEDLTNPILVDSFYDGGIPHNMFIEGDYLYLADHYQGLEIYDISTPEEIVRVGRITDDGDGEIDGVYVNENRAFVAEWHDSTWSWSMKIINVTNPTLPQLISEYTDDDNEFVRFHVENDICFTSCIGSGFKILNVSDPLNIVELDRYNDGGFSFDFKIVNNRAFIADGDDGLEILDVSNITDIYEIGNYTTSNPAFGIDVYEDYVFLGINEVGVNVLNVSDFSIPVKIGEFGADKIVGVTYNKNTIFLSMHQDGLLILEVNFGETNKTSISFITLALILPVIILHRIKKDKKQYSKSKD